MMDELRGSPIRPFQVDGDDRPASRRHADVSEMHARTVTASAKHVL